MVKILGQREKKDRVIDLTDIGRKNKGTFIRRRELVTNDDGTEEWIEVPGEVSREDFESGDWLRRRRTKPNKLSSTEGDEIPFIITASGETRQKDGGMPTKQQRYVPNDIEQGYEEGLENRSATVIDSTTYYPASGITTTKRSQTHDEIADERGYLTR